MVDYMLSLPKIVDPEMEDGTTGFSMALAQSNTILTKKLLEFYRKHPKVRLLERHRDINLTKHALLELSKDSKMGEVLEEALLAMDEGDDNSDPKKKSFSNVQRCQK